MCNCVCAFDIVKKTVQSVHNFNTILFMSVHVSHINASVRVHLSVLGLELSVKVCRGQSEASKCSIDTDEGGTGSCQSSD